MIHLQQTFNGGQMGPFLHNRADIDKYRAGLRDCLNFVPTPYGPHRRRPGTIYIEGVSDNTKNHRLLAFNVDSSSGYILELGDEKMRFYQNQARIQVNPAAWVTATAYSAGNTVENGGTDYVALETHVSAGTSEPGVGANWTDYWYALTADGTESIYELPTPWDHTDLKEIQIAQVNDLLYMVHPDYAPQVLYRYGDEQWELEEIDWTWPPFRSMNLDDTHTLNPSGVQGTITIQSSTPYFTANMEGSYIQFDHKRAAGEWDVSKDLTAATGASSSIAIRGEYQVRTVGVSAATITIQESADNGSTWEDIRTIVTSDSDNFLFTRTTADGTGDLRLVRINHTAGTSGSSSPKCYIEAVEGFIKGVARINDGGYTSSTQVTATVVQTLGSTSATARWHEGAFSAPNGYPRSVTLHELRLVFGGTATDRNTLWASQIDDFPNFEQGSADDQAWSYQLASTEHNTINWLASQKQLLVGSSGGEWVVDSGREENTITPNNVRARRHSNFGSEFIQALAVDSSTLFVRSGGERVADFAYVFEQDGYDSADLNLLSYDLTRGGITEMAYQRKRDPMVWAVIDGEGAACMAYNRRQQVTGWSPIKSPGNATDVIESIAVIGKDGDEDEVWMVVKRTINSFTVRYIELLDPDSFDKQEDATHFNDQEGLITDSGTNLEDLVFIDCSKVAGITDHGNGTSTLTGLTHLVGEDCIVFADGSRHLDVHTVDGAGEIDLTIVPTKALVGLPYRSYARTLPLFNQLQTGTTRSRESYIHKAVFFLHRSGSFKVYVYDDPNDPEELSLRSTDTPEGDATPLRDGEFEVTLGGRHTLDPSLVWETSEPLPLTVEAVAIKFKAEGE